MAISSDKLKQSIKDINAIDRKLKQYKEAAKELNDRKKVLKEVVDTFMSEQGVVEITIKSENMLIKKVTKNKPVQGTTKKFIEQRLSEYCRNRGYDKEELIQFIYSPEFREHQMVENITMTKKKT